MPVYNDTGIFIKKIIPDGAAAKSGKLNPGDQILKVFVKKNYSL